MDCKKQDIGKATMFSRYYQVKGFYKYIIRLHIMF